jgi:hypothetical protein
MAGATMSRSLAVSGLPAGRQSGRNLVKYCKMGMLITMGNVNDLKWLWGEVYEVTVGDTDGNGLE